MMAQTSKPHIEGVRVIRGPDWTAGDLDGGEGHVGTVISLPGSGMVHVIWDVGEEMDCKAGLEGKFDLRVFDSGTVDVHHEAQCQSCQQDVYGALWRCQTCPACSLCSRCYADDKHETGHQFLRFDLSTNTGKLTKKRKISAKVRAVGLFPGATVVRGHHWKWRNQDGGPGSEGEIVDYVESPEKKGRRNVVTVMWPSGRKNVYRLGFEGLVDIKCLEEEVGGFYYRDHLPVLDTDEFSSLTLGTSGAKIDPLPSDLTLSFRDQQPSEADHEPQVTHYNVNETASAFYRADDVSAVEKEVVKVRDLGLQGSASEQWQETRKLCAKVVSAARSDAEIANVVDSGGGSHRDGGWKIGDRAVIAVPKEELKELQHGFGGVTASMLRKIGRMGVVTRLGPGPNILGLRLGRTVFRLNRAVLQRVHTFTVGDKVRILDDLFKLNIINERVGWIPSMDNTAGKVGEITKIDEDGDLRVQFADLRYLYSPACCVPAPGATVDAVIDFTGGMGDNLTLMGGDGGDIGERLAGMLRATGRTGGGGGGGGGAGHRILRMGGPTGLSAPSRLGQLLGQLQDLQNGMSGMSGSSGVSGLSGLIDLVDDESEEGELHKAIEVGDLEVVKELCRAKPSMVNSPHNEFTPLMRASLKGRRKIVEALLNMGAKVNARGMNDNTPLHLALEEKKEDIALLLLERGADVTPKIRQGRTPLHMAASNRCNEAAQLIIHMGADVNAQDKDGDTPLHDAIARGNVGIVELLTQIKQVNTRLTNKRGYSPLVMACGVKNAEMLNLILIRDSSNVNTLNDGDLAAIHVAAFGKFFEGVYLLVTVGNADVNLKSRDNGLTVLHIACLMGELEAVESILCFGADVNMQNRNGDSPLHLAMGGNDGRKEKSTSEMEKDVQSRLKIARLLISSGAFVDAENRIGRLPMTYGLLEVQNGIRDFIEQNPYLVSRKKASKPASTSLTLSLTDVSMRCRLCQRPSDVTLVPCGHKTVCRACAVNVRSCPLCGVFVRREETIKGTLLPPKGDRTKTNENGVQSKLMTNEPAFASMVNIAKLDLNSGANAQSKSAEIPPEADHSRGNMIGTLLPPKVDRQTKDQYRVKSKPVMNEPAFTPEASTVKLDLNYAANEQPKSAEGILGTDPRLGNMEHKSGSVTITSASSNASVLLAGRSSQQNFHMRQERKSDQHEAKLAANSSQSASTGIQKDEPHEGRESTAVPLNDVEQSEQKAEDDNTPPTPRLDLPPAAELSSGYTFLQFFKDIDTDGQATHVSHLACEPVDAKTLQPAVLQQFIPDVDRNCLLSSDQCVTTLEPEAVICVENLPSSGWTLRKTEEAAESLSASEMQRCDVVFPFSGTESGTADTGFCTRPEKDCVVRPKIFTLVDEEAVPWSLPRRHHSPAMINDNKAFNAHTANPTLFLSEGAQTDTKSTTTLFPFSINKELEVPKVPNISLVSMGQQASSSASKDVLKVPDTAWKPQYSVPISDKRKPQTADLIERKDKEEVGTSSSIPSEPGLAGGVMNMNTSWMTSRRQLSQVSRSDDKELVPINTNVVEMTTEEPVSLTEELVRRELGLPPRLPSQSINHPKVTKSSPEGRFGSTIVQVSLPSLTITEENAITELKPKEKGETSAWEHGLATDDVPCGVDVRLSLPLMPHDLKWDSPRREKEDREQTANATGILSNDTKSRTLNDPGITSVPLMSPMQYDFKWDFSKEVNENEHAKKETEDSINTASCTNNNSRASTKSEDYSTTSLTTPKSDLTKVVIDDFVEIKDNAFDESAEKVSDAHAQTGLGHQRALKDSDPHHRTFPDDSHSVNTNMDSKTASQASIVINTERKENQLNCVWNKLAASEKQTQGSKHVTTVTNKTEESFSLSVQTPAENQNQGSVNVIGGQNETTNCSALSVPMTTVNEKQSFSNISAIMTETTEKKDKTDISKNFIHVDNLAAIFSSLRLKANAGQQGTLEAVPDNLAKGPAIPTKALGSKKDNLAMAEASGVTECSTHEVSLSRDLTASRLDEERETIAESASKCRPFEPAAELVQESAHDTKLQVGYQVVIKVNEGNLKKLQTNFGGATKNMLQCLGNTGIVTAVEKDGSVRVQFKTLSYRFNPQTLLRVPDLQVGDIVRIHDDLDLVQLLNRHVGFGSGMVETLGKAGKVMNIDSDRNVKVSFGNRSFLFFPACCVPSQGATVDTLTTTIGGESGPVVLDSSSSSSSSDCSAGIDLEGLEKVKMLAQMVKEEGSSMSRILNSVENESSAISRLFDAIEKGDSSLVRTLCQSDPVLINREHKARKLTPLMFAGWKGLEDMVSLLLDLGADVNQSLTDSSDAHNSCCPLLASLESRREDAAILLLQRGANPNCRSLHSRRTPMHYAAERDLLQVLQVLVLEGADVNAQERHGDTPLTAALFTGHTQAAEIILGDPRVDLNLANRKGFSPLHAASMKSYPSIVQEILIRDTSQVNVKMDGEYTPLHMAVNDDCLENIKLLILVGGADVNCVAGGRKHAGTRPLHMACLNGNYSCVEALLDFGAAVNVKDKDGDTPLHFAIGGKVPSDGGEEVRMMFIEGRVRIACLLICNGAFVDAENRAGRTCMSYGSPEVQAAVQDYMDRNRHLVVKQGKFGGDAQRPYRAEPGPCAVCKTRTSAVTLLPCGHKVTCSECCVGLVQCPQCQKDVLDSTTDDAKGALFEPV